MNEAEKIILCILAGTLVVFLILGIFALIKIIRFMNSLEDLVDSAKDVAANASSVVDKVANIAVVGNVIGIAKSISEIVSSLRSAKKSSLYKDSGSDDP